jgi:phosphoribosylformimino-5-aminoimidazole carboxamide ribotide isomerase
VSDSGIVAAITGRASYEGTLDFAEGQRVADGLVGARRR